MVAERRTLTRDRIVRTAVKVIERDGAAALSMRKVAAELGVGVMSLYNHVPHRDALIEGVAREVLAGLDVPGTGSDQDWKVAARALAGAFRATARRYPRSMHLVLTSRIDLEFKWQAAERALAVLDAAGFDAETSVRALRALMAYAIGSHMMADGAIKMPEEIPDSAVRTLHEDPDRFPYTIASADALLRPDPEADFDAGLDMLLAALDHLPRAPA